MKKKKKRNNRGNPREDKKREDNKIIYEGKIVDPIKNILFHVCLDHNNQIVLGYLSGNMRRNHIRVLVGDKVQIEILDSHSKKGRIIYRFPPVSSVPISYSQTSMEETKDDQQVKESLESSKDTETKNTINTNPVQSEDPEERRQNIKDKNSKQDLAD